MTRTEDRKVGLGMLSTQMQRLERSITGRTKGPPPISADPKLFNVDMSGVETEISPLNARHTKELQQQRKEFARFFPSANMGKPTPRATLEGLAKRKARDPFVKAYAARAPAQLAVRLSPQVLAMCAEYQIDIRALMREGANPLAGHVPVMDGPYTPSWDKAIGIEEGTSPRAPASARSAPASGRRRHGGDPDEGSQSARKPNPRPPALTEEEAAEVKRQMSSELEEVRKQRQEALKRRAAVALAEIRTQEESVKKQQEHEAWREHRAERAQKQLDRKAALLKAELLKAEEAYKDKFGGIGEVAKAERQETLQQLAQIEEEKIAAMRERNAKRAEAARKAEEEHAARVEANAQREAARAAVVAEYQQERTAAEKEAAERLHAAQEQKRLAAKTRNEHHEVERQRILQRRREDALQREREVDEIQEQRLEKDKLLEQQRQERLMMPFYAHEAARRRELEVPLERKRLLAQREVQLRAQLQQAEEEVADNQRQLQQEALEKLHAKREAHSEIFARLDDKSMEREAHREEIRVQIAEKSARVEKLEARKQLQVGMRIKERKAFHEAQSAMLEAVQRSSIGGSEVLTDTQLEAVVTGANKSKKMSPRR